MKTLTTLCVLAALLAACGNQPPQPDWKANAGSALGAYSDAYLKGDSAIAATEFARARSEVASTGRPDLVAHAELVACATRVASLEFDDCPRFAALAQDATPAERAYASYLGGQWQGLDVALLPEQHRAVAQGKGTLAAIADPLARLVAAGVLMRTERITPPDIAVATDTASGQGWRRPLLVWLGISLKRAQAAGDSDGAARLQRRIDIASAP
ncbi:hypothetical protein [Massilia sp. CF038]|uniref:hypothetical protein n=1 Tax=Massilia sp. CF038 TaxID=1881045 RepID=UPI00091F840D|nr:hypothetical protein [Massilia sp. CF038]SHG68926.1 hypothetical protein SAMN05428948_1619 [Massilia sp. CF038]